MAKVFIGNNGKFYSVDSLEIVNVLNNTELLSEHSLKELDVLYKKYFGEYQYTYPEILQQKIKIYDSSKDVNSFEYKDQSYWLDKNTRVGLMNLLNCVDDNIELVLGDNILTLSVDKAKKFLSELEVYSSKCYVNTQKHLKAIKELKSVEELINYDYTTGYPNKIILNE